jgi:hypothetical protein
MIWNDRRSLWRDVYRPCILRMWSWFGSAVAGMLVYAIVRHIAESRPIN